MYKQKQSNPISLLLILCLNRKQKKENHISLQSRYNKKHP